MAGQLNRAHDWRCSAAAICGLRILSQNGSAVKRKILCGGYLAVNCGLISIQKKLGEFRYFTMSVSFFEEVLGTAADGKKTAAICGCSKKKQGTIYAVCFRRFNQRKMGSNTISRDNPHKDWAIAPWNRMPKSPCEMDKARRRLDSISSPKT